MRIHSSSLTLTPAGFNRQQAVKPIGGQKKDEINETLLNFDSLKNPQSVFQTYSSKEIIERTANGTLPVPSSDDRNTKYPINTKTSRALNAYSLELNKLPVDHSSRTIQKIDIYA